VTNAQTPSVTPTPAPPFRYDAFISYRHVEPDRDWAKWLHTALETYRVPRELVRKGLPRRLTRVFRDEEELPANADLSSQITAALNESRYLIVVCSPRAVESRWVNAEVEHFRKLGRHDKILALLIEGEPAQSFPKALVEIRRTITEPAPDGASDSTPGTGTTRESIEEVEPLAADVRPERKDVRAATLKSHARLRLLACILGCRFDELRRRDAERNARRTRNALLILTTTVALIATLAMVAVNQSRRARYFSEEAAKEAGAARAQSEIARAKSEEAARQTRVADEMRSQRAAKEQEAARETYVSRLLAARAALGAEDAAGARANLAACPEADRGWEWGWLNAQSDTSSRASANLKTAGGLSRPLATDRQGQMAVSAVDGVEALIWDTRTGDGTLRLRGHTGQVMAAALSADGRLALTGAADSTARVWDAFTGAQIAVLPGQAGSLHAVAFSPGGDRAVTAGSDGSAHIWETRTGRQVAVLRGHTEWIRSASFSQDGTRVVTASADRTARVWDAATGELITVLRGHAAEVLSASFSPDQTLAATGSRDGTAAVWSVDGWGRQVTLRETGPVSAVTFSADGRLVFTGTDKGVVRAWHIESGDPAHTLLGQSGPVRSIASVPGGASLIVCSHAPDIRVWENPLPKPFRLFGVLPPAEPGSPSTSRYLGFATLSPDGTRLLVPGTMMYAEMWSLETGARLSRFKAQDIINDACFSPDGGLLALACSDRTIRILDPESGSQRSVLQGHESRVRSVLFSRDGTKLLSTADDPNPMIWVVNSGGPAVVLRGHEARVIGADLSADGTRAVTSSEDGTVRVWESGTGAELARHRPNQNGLPVNQVFFAPHSPRHAIVIVEPDAARLCDAESGAVMRSFDSAGNSMSAASISPDGRRLAAVSGTGALLLWDFASSRQLIELPGPGAGARSTFFSRDGAMLVCSSWNGTVRVWESVPRRARPAAKTQLPPD
jgi:WD40 repeat protein